MYVRMVEASTRWLPRTVIVCATTAPAWSAVATDRTPTADGMAKATASPSMALRARSNNDFIGKRISRPRRDPAALKQIQPQRPRIEQLQGFPQPASRTDGAADVRQPALPQ